MSGDTIRILGLLKKNHITILVDTDSTYNFLDIELASRLKCPVYPIAHVLVIVANEDRNTSTGICKQLSWQMQGHQFEGDIHLLPIGGCDMVLGAD